MPKYFAQRVLDSPSSTLIDCFDAAVKIAREAGYIQGKQRFIAKLEETTEEQEQLLELLRVRVIRLATGE